jgi:hypothetical protein
MTLAKAKAKTNETFIVQASLTIVTYDRKNIFIVQATEYHYAECCSVLSVSAPGFIVYFQLFYSNLFKFSLVDAFFAR